MTEIIVVHKLDEHGEEVWRYEGVLLHRSTKQLTLEARFDREDVSFHGLSLRRGDRFIETFYSDRYYNVFAVHDLEELRLKGWYCNIACPARFEPGHVFARDLALDLVVFPDGSWKVLDEDEFQALEVGEEVRQRALDALRELQSLAAAQEGPFQVGSDSQVGPRDPVQ